MSRKNPRIKWEAANQECNHASTKGVVMINANWYVLNDFWSMTYYFGHELDVHEIRF